MRQIGVQNVKLSEYEMSIAAHLVDPLTMHVSHFAFCHVQNVPKCVKTNHSRPPTDFMA